MPPLPIPRALEGRTVALIATGPSLTLEQVEAARQAGFALVGCNRTWEIVPDLCILWATNAGFWCYYWDQVKDHPAEKWTTSTEARDRFGVNWIAERDGRGLSQNPAVIHHGHGSGYSMLNLAYLMGAARIVLLGYDLRFAADYNGSERRIGSSPRHYFGEYPSHLQHWPKVHVRAGVHVDLVQRYGEVAAHNSIEIINCTPGSALKCFPEADIRDVALASGGASSQEPAAGR